MLLSAKSSGDSLYQQAVGMYLDNKVNERNYQRALAQDEYTKQKDIADRTYNESKDLQTEESKKAAKTLEFRRDIVKERIKNKLSKNKSPEEMAKDQLELQDLESRIAKTRKETTLLGQDKPATRSERIAQRRLELTEAESEGRLTKDFEKDIGKFLDEEVPKSQADVIANRLNNDPKSNVLLYTNDKWQDEKDIFQIPQGTKYKGQQVTPQMMLGMAHYWRKPDGKKYTITEVVDIIKGMSREE